VVYFGRKGRSIRVGKIRRVKKKREKIDEMKGFHRVERLSIGLEGVKRVGYKWSG